jgi:hypothetical protein
MEPTTPMLPDNPYSHGPRSTQTGGSTIQSGFRKQVAGAMNLLNAISPLDIESSLSWTSEKLPRILEILLKEIL